MDELMGFHALLLIYVVAIIIEQLLYFFTFHRQLENMVSHLALDLIGEVKMLKFGST